MIDRLRNFHVATKIFVICISLLSFHLGLYHNMSTVGYVALFIGLFVLFEGFSEKLIVKILLALGMGLLLAISSFQWSLFRPQDIVAIKPVGSVIFINCLTMALVPLVFASILTGVTSLGNLQRLNRIGLKTVIYYLSTTTIAIVIGLSLGNLIKPGTNLDPSIKKSFVSEYRSQATDKVQLAQKNRKTFFQTVQSIFPRNILESVSLKKPHMLQLIFFAIICGIALLTIDPDRARPVIAFFEGITDMTIQIVSMVMRLAPYGVFALIASTIAQTKSIDLLLVLIPFSICVLAGLFIHMFGTNSLVLKIFCQRQPGEFFKTVKEVMATAFSTSSSGATMPFTLKTTKDDLKVSPDVASFVIPLGATVNMDGSALFLGVSTLFLANVYSIPLTFVDQITVVAMATLASIGTAAVPGVSIVILTMILVSVGIPAEGILFLLPVNNLLDMFRTVVNVVGDMVCSLFVDATEQSKISHSDQWRTAN